MLPVKKTGSRQTGYLIRHSYCHCWAARHSLLWRFCCAELIAAGWWADSTTAQLASQYLLWFVPALALQFSLITMGAGLRGAGVVKPTVVILMVSVCLNLVLAPVLIFGWGTGAPLGISGAAIASLIALVAGSVMMWIFSSSREIS
jgi:Na+-driven multidrug efflux pump